MKYNIKVNEKNLIDRLNNNINKKPYETPMACRWDNNGPVQFEEDNEDKGTRLRTQYEAVNRARDAEKAIVEAELKPLKEKYEEVNHPDHYNQYDVEVIDMMERIFGKEETAIFCKLNAFKYRQRMGNKPGQDITKDLAKEKWYLAKKKELEKK